MRTRTREAVSYVGTSYSGTEHTAACNTNSVSDPLTFPYWVGEYESFTDTVIPNFAARSAKGEVFFNRMSKSRQARSVSLGGWAYHLTKKGSEACNYSKNFGTSAYCLNQLGSPVSHLEPQGADLERLMKLSGTECYADVDAPDFAGSQFIGELRETIHMLRRPLESWNHFLRKARKHKRSTEKEQFATSVAEFISSNWLMYRYGIRPLQRDVQNAVTAITNTVAKHVPERRTARGHADDSSEVTITGNAANGVVFTTTTSVRTDVRSTILYQFDRHPDTFGVGLSTLPATVWEIGTFTMVADWFYNVGDYIRAVTPKVGITKLGACQTIKSRYETKRNSHWADGGFLSGRPRIIDDSCSTDEYFVSETKRRSPGVIFGLTNKGVVRSFPAKHNIGVQRILDLQAMSHTILKSR